MISETEQGEAFIREVDEEYRRDRLAQFWHRYGRWLLLAIGVGLIAFAGFLFGREQRQKQRIETGVAYTQALRDAEAGKAQGNAALEALAKDGGGYAPLAELALGAQAVAAGDTAKATAIFRRVAADQKVAKPLRELALMKALRLDFDTQPTDKLAAELRPYAQPGNPWFPSAGEMLAAVHLREGKKDEAAALFAAIAKDDTAPPSLRARASQMAGMLGAMPPDDPVVPAETAPAAPAGLAQ